MDWEEAILKIREEQAILSREAVTVAPPDKILKYQGAHWAFERSLEIIDEVRADDDE